MVSVDGVGVPGAGVCALWRNDQVRATRADVTPRCTVADAWGYYVLELPAGVWLIVASAWGYLTNGEKLVLRETKPNASLDVALRRGGSARTGTILDLDGSPAIDVRIVARAVVGGRHDYVASARTNAQGRFELWADEDAFLEVDSPGYIDLVSHESETHTALPESVIEGRVIDQAGKPVAGARVAYVEKWDPPLGFPEHATRSDGDGKFRIANVKPGEYNVMVFRDDLGGNAKIAVEFAQTLGGIEVVVVPMLEWLRAQVVDERGEPVAGCFVGLARADEEGPAWVNTFWTDEDGHLASPTIPASYEITFLECPGKVGKLPYAPLVSGEVARLEVAPGHVSSDADGNSATPDPSDQQAPAGPKTTVRVVDASGANVGKAVVSVIAAEARLTSTSWWNYGLAITDALGRANVDPGCDAAESCTAMAVRPGMFGTVTVEPGHAGEIVVALQPTR